MRTLEAEAAQRGFRGVTLAAQLHAMPFYEHLGYERTGVRLTKVLEAG